MDIKIEKMTLTDLNSIKNTLVSEFDNFWNYNILNEELHAKNSIYIVAKYENEIIGFAGIKVLVDTADIMNIVTKKSFRNKGIGSLLLKSLISICKELSIYSVFLEVNEDNVVAIHLYEKFGFQNINIRKKYYNEKSGIIMKLIIPL